MELINLYLPDSVSLAGALALILINLLCSFISTALSLGGGLLMLVSLSFIVPPVALVPVHGIIQLGSNFARIFVSLKDLDIKIILPFMGGTLIGSFLGANVVEVLSPAIGQIGVGLFILYSLFGKFPKLGKKYIFLEELLHLPCQSCLEPQGPLVATLIKNMNFNPIKHVATHGSMMTFQHLFKSFAYFFIGFSFQTIFAISYCDDFSWFSWNLSWKIGSYFKGSKLF